jgi:hypothetical protein
VSDVAYIIVVARIFLLVMFGSWLTERFQAISCLRGCVSLGWFVANRIFLCPSAIAGFAAGLPLTCALPPIRRRLTRQASECRGEGRL